MGESSPLLEMAQYIPALSRLVFWEHPACPPAVSDNGDFDRNSLHQPVARGALSYNPATSSLDLLV